MAQRARAHVRARGRHGDHHAHADRRGTHLRAASCPGRHQLRLVPLAFSGAAVTVTKEIQTYKNVTFKGGDEKFIATEPQDPTDARGYQIQLRIAGSATNNPSLAAPALVANRANSGTGLFVPRAGRIYTIYVGGFAGGLSAGAPSATANIPTIGWYTNK